MAELLVEVTRGARVESVHRGNVVVVDSQGKIIASSGDHGSRSFFRSSAQTNPYSDTLDIAACRCQLSIKNCESVAALPMARRATLGSTRRTVCSRPCASPVLVRR